MTSVAASVFASFTTSPSPGGSNVAAQPDTDAFGAMVGIASIAPSSQAAITATPTSELKLPVNALASLLATASVASPADQPIPTPITAKDPAPDILVVQPAPLAGPISKTPTAQPQTVVTEAPDVPPIECPAAPEAPTEPAKGAIKDTSPPPPPPGNRKPESPPIISTLAPAAPAPEPTDDTSARAAEEANAEKSKADVPKLDPVADDAPPTAKPDLPAILVLPASVMAAVAPATPTVSADQPVSAPEAKTEATSAARKASPQLPATAGPIAPAHEQVIPVEGHDGKSDTGSGDDKPSTPRHATLPGKAAESATARETSPSFTPATLAPAASATSAAEIAKAPIATITAQPGRIGQELGVAIAHHVSGGNAATGGGETITLRLNPVDMGRIEVKLSFDDSGTLRAVVSADNPVALDMLRRDGADLGRALTDAGVRADAQTLRFDTRSGAGQHGGQSGHRGEDRPPWQRQSNDTLADTTDDIIAPYRPLRTRGGIDMVA